MFKRNRRASRAPQTSEGAATTGPIIRLRNVVKTYPVAEGDFSALRGVSASLHRGEFVGVVGRSGAGKSTLLNMITGVDRLTSGSVRVDGVNVHDMNESARALWRGRTLGVVYQSFELLAMLSLLENVILPMDFCGLYRPRESEARAMHLLEQVGLKDHARKPPSRISGGQQQRVAIARALANDPPILVADEPTGSLDSATADDILGIFDGLVKAGKTIIMVTHDKGLIPRFSRTLHITDGALVEDNGIPEPSAH